MIRLNTAVQAGLGKAWMLRAVGTSYEAIPVGTHVFGEEDEPASNAEAAYWLLRYVPSAPSGELKEFLKTFICGYLCRHLDWESIEDGSLNFDQAAHQVLDVWSRSYNWRFGLDDSPEEIISYLLDLIDDLSLEEIKKRTSKLRRDSGDFVAEYLDENFIRVRMNDAYQPTGGREGVGYFRIASKSKNWLNQIWSFVHDHREIQVVVVSREEGSSDFVFPPVATSRVYIDNMRREEFLSADHLPFLGSRKLKNTSIIQA